MMLPKGLAIIKCQAHKKVNDFVIKGNNAADLEAKKASEYQVAVLAYVVLIEPQHSMWHQRESKKDNIWCTHEGLIFAPTSLLNILILDAYGFDHCARGEEIRKIKQQGYWFAYLHAMVDEYLATCEVCAKNNVRKGITTLISHIPESEGL